MPEPTSRTYKLPDLLEDWPWQRNLCPDYLELKKESTAWVESFELFSPKEQAIFNRCDFALLGCLTYSARDKEFVRVGCDLMNFYFVYDEYTDVACEDQSKRIADSILRVLRNTSTVEPSSGKMASLMQEFWQRALSLVKSGHPCIEHFVDGFDDYVHAVVQETNDKACGRLRNVQDYLTLRRGTTSSKSIFALIEFGLGLPDEVLFHPVIKRLTENAADICAITNDMHSYALEQARGLAIHNIITCIQFDYGLDLQDALDWLGTYTKSLIEQFATDRTNLPSWGAEMDSKVQEYIDGLGNWVRGNDCWCYESKRYYGDDGEVVKRTRLITLRRPETGLVKKEELRAVMTNMDGLKGYSFLRSLWSHILVWLGSWRSAMC